MGAVAYLGALAHTGSAEPSETGQLVFTIGLLVVLALIWVILGVVCWIFWRAKKRDDAAREASSGWQSAPSS